MSTILLPSVGAIQTYSAFRATASIPEPARPVVFVSGRTGVGDSGAAFFVWSPASSAADDDDITIRPNDRASTNGRWIRITSQP